MLFLCVCSEDSFLHPNRCQFLHTRLNRHIPHRFRKSPRNKYNWNRRRSLYSLQNHGSRVLHLHIRQCRSSHRHPYKIFQIWIKIQRIILKIASIKKSIKQFSEEIIPDQSHQGKYSCRCHSNSRRYRIQDHMYWGHQTYIHSRPRNRHRNQFHWIHRNMYS